MVVKAIFWWQVAINIVGKETQMCWIKWQCSFEPSKSHKRSWDYVGHNGRWNLNCHRNKCENQRNFDGNTPNFLVITVVVYGFLLISSTRALNACWQGQCLWHNCLIMFSRVGFMPINGWVFGVSLKPKLRRGMETILVPSTWNASVET